MSIYDRTQWPEPQANQIIRLLESGREWFTNEEVVAALGLSAGRALLSNGTSFAKTLRKDDAAIESRGWMTPTTSISRSNGGTVRLFSRRAVVLAGMRSETVAAAAFRDWLASRVAEGSFSAMATAA